MWFSYIVEPVLVSKCLVMTYQRPSLRKIISSFACKRPTGQVKGVVARLKSDLSDLADLLASLF